MYIDIISKKHGVFRLLFDYDDYSTISPIDWIPKIDHKNGNVYAVAHLGKRKYISIHCYLMGKTESKLIDHINGNGLDNRRCNLRFVTPSQNQMNRRCHLKTYKGISMDEFGRYRVRVAKEGKMFHGGKRYNTIKEAITRYNEMAKEIHGEFAWLNPIE